jgi:AcrR family transcriptional regulator
MSPEAHAVRRDDDGGVRERILSSAIEILREKGIQEMSQLQVARRAKVRQSHLTYYFPKRQNLLEAVAVRFIDGLSESVRQASSKAKGHDTSAMMRHFAEVVTEPGHMRMFAGIAVVADSNPDCRVVLVRETLRMQAVLAEALGGEDAFERAGLVMAALWGLGLYAFVMAAPGNPEQVRMLLAELMGDPGGGGVSGG